MSEEEERVFVFTCKCGTENYIQGTPEELVGCIFSCTHCGEKVLMRNYGGERDET